MLKFALTCLFLVCFVFFGSGVEARVSMLSKMTYERDVIPGQLYTETIKVFNSSDKVEEVIIKQFDYLFDYSGKTDYIKIGSHTRSNGHWVSVKSDPIKVAPRAGQEIDIEIRVPKSDKLSGCYWSVLMVEPVERAKKSKSDSSLQVRTLVRYAIQVICNIQGRGEYAFDVKNKKVVTSLGKKALQFDVFNTGNLSISPKNWVEVFSDKGENVGVFQGSKKRVYPQTSARFLIPLEGLSKGNYNGLIIFDQTSSDYFGVRYDFTIDADGAQNGEKKTVAIDKNSDLYGLAEYTPWYQLRADCDKLRELTFSILPVALFQFNFQSTDDSYLAWAPYVNERQIPEFIIESPDYVFISKKFVQKSHLWFLDKSPIYQYRALLSKIIPESLLEGLGLISKFENVSCLSKYK